MNRFNSNSGQFDDKLRAAPIEAALGSLFSESSNSLLLSFSEFDTVKLFEWNHKSVEEYYNVKLHLYINCLDGNI